MGIARAAAIGRMETCILISRVDEDSPETTFRWATERDADAIAVEAASASHLSQISSSHLSAGSMWVIGPDLIKPTPAWIREIRPYLPINHFDSLRGHI